MPLPPSSDSEDELLDDKYLTHAPKLTERQLFNQFDRTPLPPSEEEHPNKSGGGKKKGVPGQSKVKSTSGKSKNPPPAPKPRSVRSQHANKTGVSVALSDSDLEDGDDNMMTKKFFYRFLPKEAIYESDSSVCTLTLTFTSCHGKWLFQ